MVGIYFSGTGNTKYCISYFLNKIDKNAPTFSIESPEAENAISQNKDIIFAYPIYYSNLPKIVRDFILRNSELWRNKRIYIIATMGLFSGDGAGVSARLLRKCGAEIIGGLHIRMPDCVGDVSALKKSHEANAEIFAYARESIDKSAELYLNGVYTRDGLNFFYHLAGLFGQRLYFSGKTKHYTQNPKVCLEKCTGCGVCERLCPTKNIRIQCGAAVSGNKCTMCYRCFSNCPQKAITIIGRQVIEQHKVENYL